MDEGSERVNVWANAGVGEHGEFSAQAVGRRSGEADGGGFGGKARFIFSEWTSTSEPERQKDMHRAPDFGAAGSLQRRHFHLDCVSARHTNPVTEFARQAARPTSPTDPASAPTRAIAPSPLAQQGSCPWQDGAIQDPAWKLAVVRGPPCAERADLVFILYYRIPEVVVGQRIIITLGNQYATPEIHAVYCLVECVAGSKYGFFENYDLFPMSFCTDGVTFVLLHSSSQLCQPNFYFRWSCSGNSVPLACWDQPVLQTDAGLIFLSPKTVFLLCHSLWFVSSLPSLVFWQCTSDRVGSSALVAVRSRKNTQPLHCMQPPGSPGPAPVFLHPSPGGIVG